MQNYKQDRERLEAKLDSRLSSLEAWENTLADICLTEEAAISRAKRLTEMENA